MTDIDKICKSISKELNIDYEIVHDVCMEVFKFTQNVMMDETDTHNILLNKLFTFKLKNRFKNDKRILFKPLKHGNQ